MKLCKDCKHMGPIKRPWFEFFQAMPAVCMHPMMVRTDPVSGEITPKHLCRDARGIADCGLAARLFEHKDPVTQVAVRLLGDKA